MEATALERVVVLVEAAVLGEAAGQGATGEAATMRAAALVEAAA